MTGELSSEDRLQIDRIANQILSALRRFHAGMIFTEIEAFMAPPRANPHEFVPDASPPALDGDDALVIRGDIQLRFRRDGLDSWQLVSAAITCTQCQATGACPTCGSAVEPEPTCACAGTALCSACQGVGRVLHF